MFFILIMISSVFSLIPRRFRLLMGRQLGTIVYFLSIRKDVARKNIGIAFNKESESSKELILFNCYRHFGMVLIDFLTQQSITKKNLSEYFVFHKKYQDPPDQMTR